MRIWLDDIRPVPESFEYVNLERLPSLIDKIIFTVSIDGNGVMGDIPKYTFTLSQNGIVQIDMKLTGADFRQEKAIISMEVLKNQIQRLAHNQLKLRELC